MAALRFSLLLLLGVLSFVSSSPVETSELLVKEKTKCFDELGCFSTGGPFFHPTLRPINALPDEREVINTKFNLYTRENLNDEDAFSWNSAATDLKNSHFNSSRETKFITHGFLDTQFFGIWMKRMKDEFLKYGDFNIFIIDWQGGNKLPYTQATANTRVVGAETALFINKLMEQFGIQPESCHILGHSLGGQITGYAGQRLNRLGRITAFDPAEPYFQGLPKEVRVDPTDAEFVEIIHSDGASFVTKIGLGMIDPAGHVDFYPNGGVTQPGCDIGNSISKIVTDGLSETVRNIVACQHHRAIYYYHESINSKCLQVGYACSNYDLFLSGQCSSCGSDGSKCVVMGPRAIDYKPFKSDDKPVKLYFNTNGKEPYCMQHYSVSLRLSRVSKATEVKGTFYLTLIGSKGQAEIKLNKDTRSFVPGAAYTFLVSSTRDVGKLDGLALHWLKSGLFGSSTAYVQSVTVFPMSTGVTTSVSRSHLEKKGCFVDGIHERKLTKAINC